MASEKLTFWVIRILSLLQHLRCYIYWVIRLFPLLLMNLQYYIQWVIRFFPLFLIHLGYYIHWVMRIFALLLLNLRCNIHWVSRLCCRCCISGMTYTEQSNPFHFCFFFLLCLRYHIHCFFLKLSLVEAECHYLILHTYSGGWNVVLHLVPTWDNPNLPMVIQWTDCLLKLSKCYKFPFFCPLSIPHPLHLFLIVNAAFKIQERKVSMV